jgi:hypothetical protein
MENRICILESETNEICKKFNKNRKTLTKGFGKSFNIELIEIDNLDDLEILLNYLRSYTNKCITLGIPTTKSNITIRNKNSFIDHYNNWLILDFDHQETLNYKSKINTLINPLKNSSCICKLGSSHGINNHGSWQLFYYLSRPISLEEKKYIAKCINSDYKIYQPERIIFTADPIGPGAIKIEERIIKIEKEKEILDIDKLFSNKYLGSPDTLEAIIAQCLNNIRKAEKSARNNELNKQTFIAAQACSAHGIDPYIYTKKFLNAALETGLERSEIMPTINSGFSSGNENPKRTKQMSSKDFLFKLALREIVDNKVELFKSTTGQTFLRNSSTAKCYILDSKSRDIKGWLTNLYLDHYDHIKVPTASSVSDSINGITAMALRTEPPRKIYTRIAPYPDNDGIYINLGDGKFIDIDVSGVKNLDVIPSPTAFIGSSNGAILPKPEKMKGDSVLSLLKTLFPDLNKTALILISAWLFGTFSPPTTYPILFLYGSAGTGKSSLAGALKILVDPKEGTTEGQMIRNPKDSIDLTIGVSSELISIIDNMSFIDRDLSDTLCRIVQGETIQGRALYTNFDVATLYVHKPIIITSIERIAVQSDLLSRSIIINLPNLKTRIDNRSFEEKIKIIRKRILGCLCEASSDALANYKKTEVLPQHRLSSWLKWVGSGTKGGNLGFSINEFRIAIMAAKKENESDAIEAAPVALEIINLINRNNGYWEGSIDILLSTLTDRLDNIPPNWPKTRRSLINSIARIRVDLESFANIIIEKKHKNRGNLWIIKQN